MICDLLVHVDGTDAGRERVQFATGLAVRTGARLTGIHVMPPVEMPPLYKPSQIKGVAEDLSRALAMDLEIARRTFAESAIAKLSDSTWHEVSGDVADHIVRHARHSDLVIIGQYETQGDAVHHPLPIAHSVLAKCGRPVLVVPAFAKPKPFQRIAIAWDGSTQAVRAVHDALPFLRFSHSVQILTLNSEGTDGDTNDTDELIVHLTRHGVMIEPGIIRIQADNEQQALLEQNRKNQNDLLVMGGYSHPMWLEFIFGGLTQSTLLSSGIPVLVSH